MFKSILVPTMGFSSDPAALETALLVARHFGGHLDCIHVRPDPQQILVQAAGFDAGLGMGTQMVMGDLIDVLEKEDAKRTEQSRKVFEAFCTREKLQIAPTPPGPQHGATAAWLESTGREIDLLTEGGPRPDDSTTTITYLTYGRNSIMATDLGLQPRNGLVLLALTGLGDLTLGFAGLLGFPLSDAA